MNYAADLLRLRVPRQDTPATHTHMRKARVTLEVVSADIEPLQKVEGRHCFMAS